MKDSQGWLAIVPWGCLAIVVALMCSGCTADAQVRYGYVIDPARSQLAALWDSTNAYQVERVYQVTKDSVFTWSDDALDTLYVVKEIVPCEAEGATVRSIKRIHCPDSTAPTIHVHAPTTCDPTSCAMGGINAYDGNASRTDRLTLHRKGHRYGVVQASRDVFVFYFPRQEQLEPVRNPASFDTTLRRDLYLTGLALIPMVNLIGKVDQDPGGYVPKWDQWSVFHGTAGFALESVGSYAGLPAVWTVPSVCVMGSLWEGTQAYFDVRDALATCGGAVASALIRRLFR